MVHCALHTPNICLSLLEALLEGFGMKILLMTEVKEIIQNPSNRRFADVYFKVFFSTDSCTGMTCEDAGHASKVKVVANFVTYLR